MLLLSVNGKGMAAVEISVNTLKPGAEISSRSLGLSYETGLLLPNENGVRYFRPDNQPLVRTFRTLGIQSLRIGGNSVDAARFAVPSEADIRSLFQFAKAAGVKVIYSVRLEDGDPQSAANIAKFIRKNFASTLDCFAIGNEPKGYYKDTNIFLAKWMAIRDAMLAVWPNAKFCGPDDNPSPEWCAMLARNFGGTNCSLVQITQHSYAFGCSYKNPGEKDVAKLVPVDVPAAREKMLSPDAYGSYEKILRGITNAIAGKPVSFRMTEVNSYWFSGLKGASDSYASALWGVDYLHWWTARGAAGLNFHTGDRTGGAIALPCRYAAFVSSANGYEVRPLGYGLKLFSLGGQGKVLSANVSGDPNLNVIAYANLAAKKIVCVTIINKTHGLDAVKAEVKIKLDAPIASKSAQVIFLTAKDGDIAAGSSAVTLGGAPILEDGSWRGRWTSLPIARGADSIALVLPPASAAVVKFTVK
ncbi:MAG: hypothetical protein RL616_525 [Verrucomicrobiota bacterium]